jgi:hypothetical protein
MQLHSKRVYEYAPLFFACSGFIISVNFIYSRDGYLFPLLQLRKPGQIQYCGV